MKYWLVLLIAVYWAGLIYIIMRWRVGNALTISQHAAQTKQSQRFFLALNVVCIPISWWLLVTLFAPAVRYPFIARGLYTVMALSLVASTFVPETTGWRVKAHRSLAFLMAYCFIPIELLVVLSDLSIWVRITAMIALLYFIWGVYLAFKIGRHQHDHILLFQTSNIAALHIVVLLTVFST